jgi:hypothetical protein
MMIKITKQIILMVLFIIFIAGCETSSLNKDNKPKYVISLHQMIKYPRAESIEKEIETFDGETKCININGMLHSRDIKSVERVPNKRYPGYYDLLLELSNRGSLLWMQISVGFKKRQIGFVVDKKFYRAIYINKAVTDKKEKVLLVGPFDGTVSKNIEKYAESNYLYYNPSSEKNPFKKLFQK